MQMEQVQALIFTIRQADATRLDDLAYAEKTVRMLAIADAFYTNTITIESATL